MVAIHNSLFLEKLRGNASANLLIVCFLVGITLFTGNRGLGMPRETEAGIKADLSVSISTNQSTYSAGQPVFVTVSLTNKSLQRIDLGYLTGDLSGHLFEITRPDGSQAPKTLLGTLVYTPPSAIYSIDPLMIAAGKTRTFAFDLNALFDLSLAGRYRVRLTRYVRIFPPPGAADDAPPQEIAVSPDPLSFTLEETPQSYSGAEPYKPKARTQHFVYMVEQYGRGGDPHNNPGIVLCYRVGEDGSLSRTLADVQKTELEPAAIAITPNQRFAYVSNYDTGSISEYHIGLDGFLEPLSWSAIPCPPFPRQLLMDPKGRFLYVSCRDGYSRFIIGKYGLLRLPETTVLKDAVGRLIPAPDDDGLIHPSGRFLYAYGRGGFFRYSLDPLGKILDATQQHTSAFWNPQEMAFTPDGKLAYWTGPLTNGYEFTTAALAVAHMTVDGTLLPFSRVAVLPNIENHLFIDPTGQYLAIPRESYSSLPSSILTYRIESNGGLAPLPPVEDPQRTFSLTFASSGPFVYVAHNEPPTITPYLIDKKGTWKRITPAMDASDGHNCVAVADAEAAVKQNIGNIVRGVSVEVRLAQDVFSSTDPIVLTIVLHNDSSAPVDLGLDTFDLSSFQLDVRDKDGVSAPSLAYSQIFSLATKSQGKEIVLPRRGCRQYRFLLSRLFDTSKFEDYSIQVRRRIPSADGGFTVTSPIMTFRHSDFYYRNTGFIEDPWHLPWQGGSIRFGPTNYFSYKN